MGINKQNYMFKYTVKPHIILKVGIALLKSVYDLVQHLQFSVGNGALTDAGTDRFG